MASILDGVTNVPFLIGYELYTTILPLFKAFIAFFSEKSRVILYISPSSCQTSSYVFISETSLIHVWLPSSELNGLSLVISSNYFCLSVITLNQT